MRRAKIVATIGPSSSDPETNLQLVEHGLDVARLNFSHGQHEEHAAVLDRIRAASRKAVKTVAVLQDLQGGGVEVVTARLSPLGSEGIFSSRNLILPPVPDQAVLGTLRNRLEKEEVILCCLHCHQWKSRVPVARVDEQPQCPKCSARLIAALKPWEEEFCAIAKKKARTEEEKVIYERMRRNANIVLSSGRKAVIALAAKGVGPEAASRILATMTEGDAFYREILKAERNYVRTHRFWQ